MDILKSLWADMRSKGFSVDFEKVKTNGEYTRFSRDSSGLNAFVKVDFFPEQNYASAHFGDWRTNESYNWASTQDSEMTPEESEKLLAATEERNAAQEVERKKRAEDAATSAKYLFEALPEGGENKYLFKKGLKSPSLYGARAGANGELYIPAYSGGEIVGLQKILPDGTKMFQPGMKVRGSYFSMPGKAESRRTFVCEGFATAASIWEAFQGKETVIAAFNSGNLASVVASFRESDPEQKIVVCGDEDILTKVNGNWNNSGRLAALGAGADAVCFPPYTEETGFYGSDYNDAHQKLGLDAVRMSILTQLAAEGPYPEPVHLRPVEPRENGPGAEPSPVPRAGARIQAAPRAKDKNGKTVKPSQQFVASFVLDHHGKNLVKCEHDVFKWMGTHWESCEQREMDGFYNQCKIAAGTDFKAGEIDGIYKLFLKAIPHVPNFPKKINLYESRPDRANFLNGTLHIHFRQKTPEEMAADPSGGTHFYSTEFHPHRREDYCVNVLPVEYKPVSELPDNPEYEKMVRDLWPSTDPEQAAKIRLYEQVLGAALTPMFPMIFFFLGQAKTGKSTALILVRHLLSNANVSRVDPTKWGKEFYLEAMAGKLANIVTDISTERRFDQEIPKLVIDRECIQINRKGKKTVDAMLPAFHAFGSNEMPPTLNANSDAFERRIIIVHTNTIQPGNGGGGDFAAWVWDRGPEGVLKAALRGLDDLLRSGAKFAEPPSSKDRRGEWLNEGDAVAQFVSAIKDGEVSVAGKNMRLVVDPNAKIKASDLYQCFLEWTDRMKMTPSVNDPARFGQRFGKQKIASPKKSNGVNHWAGVGLIEENPSF